MRAKKLIKLIISGILRGYASSYARQLQLWKWDYAIHSDDFSDSGRV